MGGEVKWWGWGCKCRGGSVNVVVGVFSVVGGGERGGGVVKVVVGGEKWGGGGKGGVGGGEVAEGGCTCGGGWVSWLGGGNDACVCRCVCGICCTCFLSFTYGVW